MKTRTLLVLLLALKLGCASDEDPFLPLDQLCPAIAVDVCAARSGCCEGGSEQAACEKAITQACNTERASLTQETSLSYDGERAYAVRSEQQSTVQACEPMFALSRFFEGGKANGTSCERHSECAQGACAEKSCAQRALPALCAEVP